MTSHFLAFEAPIKFRSGSVATWLDESKKVTLEVYALYDQDFIVLYPIHPRYAIPRHKTLDIEIISTFNVRFILESPIERYFPDCYV